MIAPSLFVLEIPDEADLAQDDELPANLVRVMEAIERATLGLFDAWADQRVLEEIARRQGWPRVCMALRSLECRGLAERRHQRSGKRPHGRDGAIGGTIWRLSSAGRIEHFAQRGRIFR